MKEVEVAKREVTLRLEVVALVLVVSAFLIAIRFLPIREALEDTSNRIDSLGLWGPIAFISLYITCIILMIPRSILSVGAGLQFGLLPGFLWVILGANLGASLAFIISRYLVRNAVERWLKDRENFQTIIRAVDGDGWRIVTLTRLSPLFPFALVNYVFGITKISWAHFAAGSFFGMLPGTVLLVSVGYATDLASEAGEPGSGRMETLALIFAFAVAIAATAIITRFAREALRRRAEIDLPKQ